MNRQMTQGTVANNVQVIPATKRRVSAGGQLKKAREGNYEYCLRATIIYNAKNRMQKQ